jgi:hypothetical protein
MPHSTQDPAPGVARAAHVIHLAPPDAARLAQIVMPSLAARADEPAAGLRTLILTADEETAIAVAREAARDVGGGEAPIVAVTAASRARRVFKARVPSAVAMPLAVAHALLTQSALPVGGVRNAVFAVSSAPLPPALREAIDAIMAEIPRTASRMLVAGTETPDVLALTERHFFKARRVRDANAAALRGFNGRVEVLVASPATRWDALRRFLDQVDPPSCAIIAATAAQRAEADAQLAVAGYGPGSAVVTTRETPEYGTSAVVLFGVPDARLLEQAVAAGPARVLIVCAPNEVGELRALTPAPVHPVTLDGARARSESREAAVRGRLREILASGALASELNLIAPLLDEFDGSEIAAATIALLNEMRRAPAMSTPPSQPAPRDSARPPRDTREARDTRNARPREGERPRRFERGTRPGDDKRDRPRRFDGGDRRGPGSRDR